MDAFQQLRLMRVNREFERMWKEAALISFKVLSWQFSRGIGVNYENTVESKGF